MPFDYTVPAPFTHTSEAVRAWVHGWAVSRGAAAPSSRPWGFTVEIGLPGHAMSHVLPSPDERTVREITGRATGPGVWLKALVPPTTLAPWLAPGWSLPGGPGALMSTPLSVTPGHLRPVLPPGYQLRTRTGAGVTRAVVCAPDGARAARGRIAVTGSTAVVDQVETGPAHRRRGLGRLIMHTLTDAAADQGATAGLLAATPEGRPCTRRPDGSSWPHWPARYGCRIRWRPAPDPERRPTGARRSGSLHLSRDAGGPLTPGGAA